MSNRPIVFDTGYHMMWSLLDGVTPAQIREEIPRLEVAIRKYRNDADTARRQADMYASKLAVLHKILDRAENKRLHDEFRLTNEHRKLMQHISWKDERPFAYLDVRDVVEILEWEKPNDEPSNEQVEKAQKLLKELPIAVDRILKGDI